MVTEVQTRKPPFSIEAEESVLASILISGSSVMAEVVDILKADDFLRDGHRWTFEAMLRLQERRQNIDAVTVTIELERMGHLEAVGGHDWVLGLMMAEATSANAVYYAGIVRDCAIKRALTEAADEIANAGHHPDILPDQAMRTAEEALQKVHLKYPSRNDHIFNHDEALSSWYEHQYQTAEMLESGGTWLETPWAKYNEMVRLRPECVTVLAGPTGHGKTTAAEMIADYGAERLGLNCFYIFNELNNTFLQTRRAVRNIQIVREDGRGVVAPSFRDIEDGKYFDHPAMHKHLDSVMAWPGKVTYYHALNQSVFQICTEIREASRQGLADFVILDYLQLIPRDGLTTRTNLSDARSIGIIMTMLKQTCASLPNHPPLIVVSQVSRGIDSKDDCRIDKLRDSGEIGEYSNAVTIVFNQWSASKGACIQGCTLRPHDSSEGQCNHRCVWFCTVKNTFGANGDVLLRTQPWKFRITD